MEADFTRMDSDRLRAEDAARDTGVKLSGKTMVTHKVDPVIDEARLHIAFDLLSSGSLRALGSGLWATARGPAILAAPRCAGTATRTRTTDLLPDPRRQVPGPVCRDSQQS